VNVSWQIAKGQPRDIVDDRGGYGRQSTVFAGDLVGKLDVLAASINPLPKSP
jgi:hypothetical protein